MSDDRKTIGVTAENQSALQRLISNGQFGSELDAAKFAMAYAIRSGTQPGRTSGADTKWNVGSVDSDGKLRTMLMAIYPEVDEPYRAIEYLINYGLSELAGAQVQSPDVYATLFET